MVIKWLKDDIGTGIVGLIAKVGEIVDHPDETMAREIVAHGNAEQVEAAPTQAPAPDVYTPSGRLTDISGIGVVHAAKLAKAGIAGLGDLAQAAAADVEAAAQVARKKAQEWIAEANAMIAEDRAEGNAVGTETNALTA